MAFSPSGSRRGTIVGPSRLKGKPLKRRRCFRLRNLLSTNLCILAFFFCALLFLFVILTQNIPKPQNLHRPHHHPFSRSRNPNSSLLEARVDITTKDLYDRIEFLDVDGGPWKQGWEVSFKGDEWDGEKLKVFVVPHSHNDPGWKLTVEEYYLQKSRHILDAIVQTLSKDSRRKFIWEEMSYLERWWRDASASKRDDFIKIVKNGQLEIVGGGWVMNDEANSHYFAIIEQMMEGNMWLKDTIGVIPKNAWAIDPFGYSSTMAYLLRRMGFENMLIQRTHYEVKKELALHQNLEYIWRQSWDAEETTDIFVHMMPFYSYDIPHTCGPEPAVCCQFDFARTPGFFYEACPWRINPVETDSNNVRERALLLLDQYKKKSTLYRTNTLLIPLGDDFRYVSVDEAEAQFRNYQLIFDYINSNPDLKAEAKFGTLEDYFQTLRSEAERINFSRAGEVGSREVEGFPSLSGDFFTYADREKDYWSGYYVSRPFFKAVDRVLEETLRSSEIMMALLLGYCQRLPCAKLPISFAHKFTAARRNLALFQHHDGVTGTAKDHVVVDYGGRMHTSLHDLQIFMAKAVEALLNIRHEKVGKSTQPSLFEPAKLRSRYDVQPMYKTITVLEGSVQSVIFFNPLEQTRDEVVMVVVDNPSMCVLYSNWSSVTSQVVPEWQHGKDGLFTGRHRLYWQASVPPMGLQTYYVANGFVGCEKARPSKLKVHSGSKPLPCPQPYVCSKLEESMAEVRNQHQTLTFDVKKGMLQKLKVHKDGTETIIGEEIGIYSTWESGAYLFKPNGEAEPIIREGGMMIISEGLLVNEAFSFPKTLWSKSPVSHSTRIFNGEDMLQKFLIEKEYHVELLDHDFNDKELIVRFKTDIDNGHVFYTDLNGFQMSRRETYKKIPLQGNYYPMPSHAFLHGSDGRRFSVHSRQSLGAASLKNGWLEIMVDRRLTRDDGRGLGQGVLDNRPINVLFHILTETNKSSTPIPTSPSLPLNPSLLSHLVGAHINYPMHAFIGKPEETSSQLPPPKHFSPLAASLPCDVHIVSFKVPRPLKFSQLSSDYPRFLLILRRRGLDSSYCRKGGLNCTTLGDRQINVFSMFKDFAVLDAKATSLNLLHDDDMERLGYYEHPHRKDLGGGTRDGHVLLLPMELQAYKLELRSNL